MPEATTYALRAESLGKVYRKYRTGETFLELARNFVLRRYESVTAVDSVSFTLEAGTCVGLLGPNGAGKTTLVKMLSGLLVPSSGKASVLGFTPWERDHEFLRQIGVVMGQKQQLWIDVSAYENLRLSQVIYGIDPMDFKKRLKRLARMLDVEELLHAQIRKLSLGEKMKMELLAAFLHKPRLLFLDEPTLGLDVVAQSRIRDFIREQVQEVGVTVLLTSHYLKDLEELCPRVLLIQHGKLLHDGPLAALGNRLSDLKRVTWVAAPSSGETPAIVKELGARSLGDGRFFVEARAKEVPAIVRTLLSSPGIEDLTIEAPPIEEAVRAIFTGADLK